MPWGRRRPGATASIIKLMLLPERRTTRAPTATPAGVAPPADDAGGDAPERDTEHAIPVAAPANPATAGEPDAGCDADEQHHAVHVQRQRPEAERAARRRWDGAQDDAGHGAIVPDCRFSRESGPRAPASNRAGSARSPRGGRRPDGRPA